MISYPNTCEFCNEFRGGNANGFRLLFEKSNLPSRIIQETQHLIAVSALGSLLPGYILVLPKEHILSFAQLKAQFFSEVDTLICEIRWKVQQSIEMNTVIFEHGMITSSTPSVTCGACVDHAHIHICPTLNDFTPDLDESSATRHMINRLDELSNLKTNYLFYESLDGKKIVYELLKPVPSQYMRRLWANVLSIPDQWDWAIYPMPENIIKTLSIFHRSEF